MARLNEPPASPENIESLRRKFIRQNRDIARANSAQSLRIRNLENEISKLLSENLELRQQILRLQTDLQDLQTQRHREHTLQLKNQLEAKLRELSALVSGLGRDGDEDESRHRSRHGKKSRRSTLLYDTDEIWKSRCSLNEAIDENDSRLPAILEDKSYPRSTLSNEEIFELVADSELDATDSPEIGPPPISQFVDEEPVKIDLPERAQENIPTVISAVDPTLSVTVEQRKKRKSSIDSCESKKSNWIETTPKLSTDTDSLKAGAKRKLSVRDDFEDTIMRNSKESSPDNSKFCRTAQKGIQENEPDNKQVTERSLRKSSREATSTAKVSEKTIPNARILAPKCVNNSPRKNLSLRSGKPDKFQDIPITTLKEKSTQVDQIIPSLKPELKKSESHFEHNTRSDPQTPTGAENFPEQNVRQLNNIREPENRSPRSQPASLTDASRPSRRARASVSYVEPNLRHKMRRPTKELADAVATEKAFQKIKIDGDDCFANATSKISTDAGLHEKLIYSTPQTCSENSPDKNNTAPSNSIPSRSKTHRKRCESPAGEAAKIDNEEKYAVAVFQTIEARIDTNPSVDVIGVDLGNQIPPESLEIGRNYAESDTSRAETTLMNDRVSRRRRTTLGQGNSAQREQGPAKAVRKSTNTAELVLPDHPKTGVGVPSRRSLMT